MEEKVSGVGDIFFYSYSGLIVVDEERKFEQQNIRWSNCNIVIEPPQRVSAPTWRPIPQLTSDILKRIIPQAPDDIPSLEISALPTIKDGKTGVALCWGNDAEPPQSYVDTILVHVYGGADRDQVADQFVSRMLVWLRLKSRQWWIGKSSEPLTGNKHLAIELRAFNQAHGYPIMLAKQVTPSQDTLAVSPCIWNAAIMLASGTESPDVGELLCSEAQYNYHSGNLVMCFISVCSSFEMMRDEVTKRRKCPGLKGTDLLVHLSRTFEGFIARNLEKERPSDFEFLKSCWIARGHLAHGNAIVWRHNGVRSDFSKVKAEWFFDKVKAIHAWLRSL